MNGHSTGRPREVHAITASPPHSSGRRTESYSPSLDYGDDDFGEEGDDFERHAPHRREERWGNGDQVPDHDEDLDEVRLPHSKRRAIVELTPESLLPRYFRMSVMGLPKRIQATNTSR